jgi:2-methylisocitrate lyase-like PEP mutase family enzyme
VAGDEAGKQQALVPSALERAHAYHRAGADCVYPIGLWEPEALRAFVAEAGVPVNALAMARGPSLAEHAELGLARVSYGSLLHRELMERFGEVLGSIAKQAPPP